MLSGRLLMPAVGLVMLVGAAPAAATTITVTTTNDDQNPGDGQCSLRKAIEDVDSPGSSQTDCAPAAFGSNTILLAGGSYQLSFGGPLTVSSTVESLRILGQGEHKSFIDARLLGNRVFTIFGGARVVMQGLTIANGHAPDGAGGAPGSGAAGQPGASGGGILNQGNLSLFDSAITGSQAGAGGAGGTAAASGNGGDGGAGGSGGAIYNTGNLSLVGATLGNDDAGSGGAGSVGGPGPSGSTGGIGGNGGDGGAVTNAGGVVTVLDSTFRSDGAGNGGPGGGGGSASSTTGGAGGAGGAGARGGGIAADGGSLSVTNSTFASNSGGAGGAGGNGGPAPSTGAAFGGTGGVGGAAGSGGGIAGSSPSTANLLQITAAGNNAGSPGAGGSGGAGATAGGMGASGGASSGGGVFDQGSAITLQNSLLALNGGGNCGGAILDGGHNLAHGDASCPATFASGNPNLGALQDNGGPAPTISLQPGSAAIDQIPASGANCAATDERGVPRPSGPKCDIGAYEVAPPAVKTGAATKVNRTFVTLNGVVTPNAGTAGVGFQYGKTPRLGSRSPILAESGITPIAVSVRVLQLKPDTTYYYRVVATSSDGTSYGTIAKFKTTTPSVIAGLSITPPSFRARGGGTTIGYTDSLPGKTQFVVLRCVTQKHGKCVRTKRAGAFSHVDNKGRNRFKWSGRLGRTALARGNYLLEATPQSPRVGQTVTARFAIT